MSFLSKIFELIFGYKLKKEAKQLVQSEEYQNALKDRAESTKELNKLTNKLKPLVDDYKKNIDSLQKAGVKVTMNMSGMEQLKAFKEWQETRNKNLSKNSERK